MGVKYRSRRSPGLRMRYWLRGGRRVSPKDEFGYWRSCVWPFVVFLPILPMFSLDFVRFLTIFLIWNDPKLVKLVLFYLSFIRERGRGCVYLYIVIPWLHSTHYSEILIFSTIIMYVGYVKPSPLNSPTKTP